MTRRWLLALIGCLFLSACGGNNPYLEQSLKPAELQGKTNPGSSRIGASRAARRLASSAAKHGPTSASPAENLVRHSSISHQISARLP